MKSTDLNWLAAIAISGLVGVGIGVEIGFYLKGKISSQSIKPLYGYSFGSKYRVTFRNPGEDKREFVAEYLPNGNWGVVHSFGSHSYPKEFTPEQFFARYIIEEAVQ